MTENGSSRKLLYIVGFMLLIGLGVVVLGVAWAYKNAQKSKEVRHWPTAQAYIMESKIIWTVERSRSSSGSHSAAYFYELAVTFGYEVNGRFFASSTPAIERITDSLFIDNDPWENEPNAHMLALFKKVPQGCMVPVHVNPQNAGEAYIFPQLPFWQQYSFAVFMVLFGLGFSALPLFFIALILRKKKKVTDNKGFGRRSITYRKRSPTDFQ